jgi:hypothetical protein
VKVLKFAEVLEPKWASVPLGISMHKLNLDFFYHLGASLNGLSQIVTQPGNVYRLLVVRRVAELGPGLYALLTELPALNVCRVAGNELLSKMNVISNWSNTATMEDYSKPDSALDNQFIEVIEKAKELETVLRNELTVLEVYHTTQIGGYNTTDLIMQAEKTLPVPILGKIDSKVIDEIRFSGRCLVFDSPTASGFHILRAIEAILHKYYLVICKPESKAPLESWAAYINALYKIDDPEVKKVVALLQQIKHIDRNNIMHPEIVLTPDEAFTLFETAKCAIILMASKLPREKKRGKRKNESPKA